MSQYKYYTIICHISLLAFFVLAESGCASLQIPETKHSAATASQASIISFKAIAAKDLFPEKNNKGRLKAILGKHKGNIYQLDTSYKNNNWKISTKNHHIGYYHLDSKGQIVLEREDDLEENVRVEYSPAIAILPAKLKEKSHLPNGTVNVKVTNLKTGKQRAKGKCTYAITDIKEVKLSTPAGTYKTYLVKSDRKMDLTLAKVHVVIVNGYSPDTGIVLEDVTTKTRTVGIFSDSSRSRLERAKSN